MTYPDGRVLDYAYGSAGSPTDRLSRVVSIDDGVTSLVEYEHTGSGQVITTTYSEPGIEKSLALGSGSNPYSASGSFRTFDRSEAGVKASSQSESVLNMVMIGPVQIVCLNGT